MGVKTFYFGEFIGESNRETVMFQGPENVLNNIFTSPETKAIIEASGHIYVITKIKRWIKICPNS